MHNLAELCCFLALTYLYFLRKEVVPVCLLKCRLSLGWSHMKKKPVVVNMLPNDVKMDSGLRRSLIKYSNKVLDFVAQQC